jgi:NitT/TauT family transport system substrate-binding protein
VGTRRVAWLLSAVMTFAVAAPHMPASAQELERIVVALPEGPSARTLGYRLAKAEGAFAQFGLDPILITADSRGPITMLADSDVDLAVDIMPHALTARAEGAKIVHVAQLFQKSGLLLACRQPIREVKDLKGMNVSLWPGGLESPFYAWMQKVGIGIYGEADGVTVLREGDALEPYRNQQSDCFTSERYALPVQLARQGRNMFDFKLFLYEEIGTATLEDGLYAQSAALSDPKQIDRIVRFLAASKAGWQSAADDPRKAAESLAAMMSEPAPDISVLLRSVWAANDLVEVEDRPFGRLDPAAYDRTVTVLLTGAPDPVLKTAPLSATSDVAIKALEAR